MNQPSSFIHVVCARLDKAANFNRPVPGYAQRTALRFFQCGHTATVDPGTTGPYFFDGTTKKVALITLTTLAVHGYLDMQVSPRDTPAGPAQSVTFKWRKVLYPDIDHALFTYKTTPPKYLNYRYGQLIVPGSLMLLNSTISHVPVEKCWERFGEHGLQRLIYPNPRHCRWEDTGEQVSLYISRKHPGVPNEDTE